MGENLDWSLIMFTATSMFHDYWVHFRLPKVYYYEMQKEEFSEAKAA
ncbi:MAG TPA: hypothetical protein VFT51_06845 [Bacillales bacterium]|nr:hypothetical protein [Bacillales bacterium]